MTHDRFVYASTPTPSRILSKLSFLFTMTTLMLLALVGMTPQAGAQSCTGLCLQQITCPAGGTTSISGKVYAPNGTDVLPGVLVYIPNAAVQPFASGAQCLIAGQPASGSPLISTVTAADGTFTLTNAPVGSNIPLVIQAGKWRRQFVIPTVSSCSNTALPATGASQIRFPRTKAEGDIPQIAIVTGAVDSLECVMRKIGVADTEFTIQGAGGRINFYTGAAGPGATFQSGTTPSETVLESSAANLAANDLVMLGCQGEPYTPAPGALNSMQSYANAGGRIYATHYSYDFLTSTFPNVAQWDVEQNPEPVDQTAYIDQTFPKGVELATWLQNVGGSTTFGQLPVQVIRKDQDGVNAPTQSFLSIKNPAESIQFTFNTPVAAPPAAQCGRVLFNEYHVENATDNTGLKFPNECPALGTPLTPQEKLLEFSIFDLSTFVSPDIPPAASVTFTNQAAPVVQGDSADTVVVTVTNTSTTDPANPSLTATVQLPAGLTATAIGPQNAATSGWTCNLANLTCTRSTGLSAGASDAILVTFSVSLSAPAAETITATAAGGGLAANVSNTDSFPVLIVPTVTWPTPAAVFYGTQLSSTQLDATFTYNGNPVPGVATYNPAAGTKPLPGNDLLSVSFVPTDPTTYTGASGSVYLQVNQATPTITWTTPAAITYGTPLSATQLNATATFNGATVTGTFTYNPLPSTVLGAGANQALSVSFAPNDTTTYTTATGATTITVNPAPLTATAGSYTGTYDGGSHALTACVVSSNPDGLTCTNSPAGPVGPDVSSSTVTPVLSGTSAQQSNYTVVLNNGSYAITALAVNVAAGSYSGTYDAHSHSPSACTSTYAGVTCVNNPASVGPGAGAGPVNASTMLATGVAADYSITSAPGSYSIAQASTTVVIVCPTSVTYTGSAQTPCTASESSGADGTGGPVNVTYTTNVNVGTAQVSAIYAGDSNHSGSSKTGSFVITAAPLTVTAGSYAGTYDGQTQALSACVVSSNPDGLTCTNNPSGTIGADVSSITVTPTLSGTSAQQSNYTVSANNGSYSITPLAVTIMSGGYAASYDGNTHATAACTSNYAGVTCTNNPALVGPDVGHGAVVPVVSIATGIASDYSITAQNSAWSIIPAYSNLNITCPSSVVYNGSGETPCSATVTGAGGLNQSVSVGYFNNTNVGTATVTATFAQTNYLTSTKMTTFTITPAVLTATAGSYSGTYDGHAHAVSACVVSSNPDGLLCSDSPSSVTDVGNSGAVVPVLSGAASSNYTINKVNGSVSITPLAVSLTAGSYSGVYDGNSHAPSACVSSYSTFVSCTDVPTAVGPGVGFGSVNPSSPLILTGTAADYIVTQHAGSYSIAKATPTLTWATPAAITYGTALSSTQLNATANVGGGFVYLPASGVLAAGPQTLSVTFTPTDSTDYTSAMKSVSLTVNKASTTTTIAVTTTQTATGTTATIAATVKPQISGTPTGTVTYMSGTTVLGSAAVGTPFTTGVLPAGSDPVSATYSGDSNFSASSSAATTVTSVAPTTIQLIIPLPIVLYPLPVAYTVIVPLKNFQLISGTITIYDGTTLIATLPLLPGGIDVGLTLPSLKPGTHLLKAVYSGDSHYPAGQSPVITVTVL